MGPARCRRGSGDNSRHTDVLGRVGVGKMEVSLPPQQSGVGQLNNSCPTGPLHGARRLGSSGSSSQGQLKTVDGMIGRESSQDQLKIVEGLIGEHLKLCRMSGKTEVGQINVLRSAGFPRWPRILGCCKPNHGRIRVLQDVLWRMLGASPVSERVRKIGISRFLRREKACQNDVLHSIGHSGCLCEIDTTANPNQEHFESVKEMLIRQTRVSRTPVPTQLYPTGVP